MADTDICRDCGHERLYHQGSGLFSKVACGVTYCRCKAFKG